MTLGGRNGGGGPAFARVGLAATWLCGARLWHVVVIVVVVVVIVVIIPPSLRVPGGTEFEPGRARSNIFLCSFTLLIVACVGDGGAIPAGACRCCFCRCRVEFILSSSWEFLLKPSSRCFCTMSKEVPVAPPHVGETSLPPGTTTPTASLLSSWYCTSASCQKGMMMRTLVFA